MKSLGCLAEWAASALTAFPATPHHQRAANTFCAIGSASWWHAWMTWTPKTSCMIKWSRLWITPSLSAARGPTSRKRTVSGGEQIACPQETLCFYHVFLFSSVLFPPLLHGFFASVGSLNCPITGWQKTLLIFANRNPPVELCPFECQTFYSCSSAQKIQPYGCWVKGWLVSLCVSSSSLTCLWSLHSAYTVTAFYTLIMCSSLVFASLNEALWLSRFSLCAVVQLHVFSHKAVLYILQVYCHTW